jgi:hypothetical protein
MALPSMYTYLVYRNWRRKMSGVIVTNISGDPHLLAMADKCCRVLKVLQVSTCTASSTMSPELFGVVIPDVNDVLRVAV